MSGLGRGPPLSATEIALHTSCALGEGKPAENPTGVVQLGRSVAASKAGGRETDAKMRP